MCLLSVQVILYVFIILCNNRIIIANTEYPPLFESGIEYLFETLEWESNKPFDRINIHLEYDFIVVGAGSAGSVVANRLSEVSSVF